MPNSSDSGMLTIKDTIRQANPDTEKLVATMIPICADIAPSTMLKFSPMPAHTGTSRARIRIRLRNRRVEISPTIKDKGCFAKIMPATQMMQNRMVTALLIRSFSRKTPALCFFSFPIIVSLLAYGIRHIK